MVRGSGARAGTTYNVRDDEELYDPLGWHDAAKGGGFGCGGMIRLGYSRARVSAVMREGVFAASGRQGG